MGIWIDTDMGFDDIAAILTVARSGLEIDGISLVFGNTPLEQVCRNTAAANAVFGWQYPVSIGRDRPVLAAIETAQAILGDTGIPTLRLALPVVEPVQGERAFDALVRWLEAGIEPRRILALGPLSNIAAVVLARPDLVAKIGDLTWMGGGATRGNHTASAEFNALADPEAAAIVLAHGLPLNMVDLDFCRQILSAPHEAEQLRGLEGRNAPLLADLFGGFIAIATSRGRKAMALYDPAAAAAFVRPDLVTWQPVGLQIELSGTLTRGRTVVENRASHATFNARLAVESDGDRLKSLILDALAFEARR
jgi:purine nucleosidase